MPPYRSAFEAYRGWSEAAAADWRAANDTALRLGGHAGHLRAARPGEAEPKPAPDQKQGTAADSPAAGGTSKPAGKAP